MAGNIKGITIEIGGDTQKLNKALEGVNKQSKDIQSELKQVERLLKLDPGNTELVAQKQKLLADAIGTTKSKLDTLREAERQVQQQFQEGKVGEEQYRLIQREVIKTEQDLKNLEQTLSKTNRDWEALGKNLQDVGGKMKDVGGKMTVGVTAPIAAAGVAGFKFAADLQDAMGASDQIFKNASNSVKTWANNLESFYGIAEGEALTYANTMGAMLQNIGGLGEEEAAKQAQMLVELAGDLTAMFGGTTESAIQALTGALKGNTSMLDNYGMGVTAATIKTKALQMGLIAEGEELDLASKQAATLALIMEQTADAQGQAARESEGASGSLRGLQTELKNVSTEIGEVLLPIITPFITKVKEMVQSFGELSPETQKVILVVAGLAAAIGPLLMIVGSVVSMLGSLTLVASGMGLTLGGLLLPVAGIAAAIAALVAAGVALYKNWDEIKAKATELASKVAETWNNLKTKTTDTWNSIKTFLTDLWNKLKTTVETIFNAIKKTIETAMQNIQKIIVTVWTAIKNFLEPLWNTLKIIAEVIFVAIVLIIQTAMQKIQSLINTIWTAIRNFLESIWNSIKNTAQTIFNAIKTYFENILNFYKTIFETVWNTIKSILQTIWNSIKAVAETIFNAIKSYFESVLNFYKTIFETTWNAIKSFLEPLWNSIKTIAETIFNGLKDFLSGTLDSIQAKFSEIWESIKSSTASAWEAMKDTIRTAINGILGFINSMIRAWNGISFQVPQVTVPFVGTFGGFRVGTIQIPEIPYLGKGGLVTKEMLAMVGDGGPEAVIPLKELKKMVAEIAAKSSEGNSKGKGDIVQNINIQAPTPLSPAETARQFKKAQQLLALGF